MYIWEKMDFTPFGEMKYKGHDLFVLDIHE